MYNPTAFYWAMLLCEIVTHAVYPFFVSLGSFYFIGFEDSDLGAFWTWTGILALTALMGLCFGLMIGTITHDAVTALEIMMNSFIIFYMGAGILSNVSNGASWFLSALEYISPFRYTSELGMRRILTDKNTHISAEILKFYGYTWGPAICYSALACFTVLYFCAGWIILVVKNNRS